jgi:hypothetical protein
MSFPHAVVVHQTMDKDDGRAASLLQVRQARTVHVHVLDGGGALG